jgi:hypothetical protein
MTEQEGERSLGAPELTTGDLTTEEELAGQARRLGRQHSSAAIAPFGDMKHVYWGEGSAHLLGMLGVTSPATADNAPGRQRLAGANLRRARGPRARGRRSRLMTASISPGVFVMSLVTAEGGGFHSG